MTGEIGGGLGWWCSRLVVRLQPSEVVGMGDDFGVGVFEIGGIAICSGIGVSRGIREVVRLWVGVFWDYFWVWSQGRESARVWREAVVYAI